MDKRDERLDDPGRQRHQAVERQPQRERMGHREGRDLHEHRPQPRAQQEEADDEQDVVEPLGQDVRVAEDEIVTQTRAHRRRRKWPAQRQRRAPGVALDPLGARRTVGQGDGQRIGIDDQAVIPAQPVGGGRQPAAQRIGGQRELSRRHHGRRRRVLGADGPHLPAVDEQHDAVDHVRRQRGQARVTRRRVGGVGGGPAGKRLHPQQQPRRVVGETQDEGAVGGDGKMRGGALEVVAARGGGGHHHDHRRGPGPEPAAPRGHRRGAGARAAGRPPVPAHAHRGYHTLAFRAAGVGRTLRGDDANSVCPPVDPAAGVPGLGRGPGAPGQGRDRHGRRMSARAGGGRVADRERHRSPRRATPMPRRPPTCRRCRWPASTSSA